MLIVYEELGDASRRLILGELLHGPKSVSDIVRATGLKQPNVSNHLARMRERDVVRASRLGRQVFYSLASPDVEAIVGAVFKTEENLDSNLRLDELAKRYAKSAVNGDEAACSEILEIVFRAKLPVIDIYQEIIAPAMHLVGKWYLVEAIDEAQEHLASYITERLMTRAAALTSPINRHGGLALLGCGPESYHTIGLRMASDVLRIHGWKTLFLGANTPVESFVNAVDQHRPALVLIGCSAQVSQDASLELVRALDLIRTRKHHFTIGAGGWAVTHNSSLFLSAGVDFVSLDLREFVKVQLPPIEAQLAVGS